jgi:hypothetical protein
MPDGFTRMVLPIVVLDSAFTTVLSAPAGFVVPEGAPAGDRGIVVGDPEVPGDEPQAAAVRPTTTTTTTAVSGLVAPRRRAGRLGDVEFTSVIIGAIASLRTYLPEDVSP